MRVFDAAKPDDLLQHIGEFVIVAGIVKSVGDRRWRLYLNFGSNWADDTTAVVAKKGFGAYHGDMALLTTLNGRHVEDAQGPLIRIVDEAQIEISGPWKGAAFDVLAFAYVLQCA